MKAVGPGLFEVIRQLPLITGDRLRWMSEVHERYGDVVRVNMGARNIYAVFHPDHVRHVLAVNAGNYWKGRTFEKTAAYLGNGLATSEGKEWYVQRRRMNPHFHRDALQGLIPVMNETTWRMLSRWREAARSEETIDLALEFQRLAMETVARAFFGLDVPETRISEIIEAFKLALVHTTRRTLNPIDIPESLPLPSNRAFDRAIKLMDSVVYEFIRDLQNKPPSALLLSKLAHATDPETGEKMSDKQIRDEVMTMFLGGTDTSGNTMSWTLYNICRFPEVLARVQGEIAEKGVVADMEYLPRVIDETLRLFPQNWVMSRDSIGEDTIGGYDIPKGSTVFLGVYIVHRRPDFWTDPLKFDPDRFLPENVSGRHPMSYVPFGGGTRKCIGYQFAMMEMTLALSMVFKTFDVKIVDPEKIKPYPTWSLWPRPGILVKLRERN